MQANAAVLLADAGVGVGTTAGSNARKTTGIVMVPVATGSSATPKKRKLAEAAVLEGHEKLQKEFVPGNDYFQYDHPGFVWVGHGGCATNPDEVKLDNYCDDKTLTDPADSIQQCSKRCLESDTCIGFEYDLYTPECSENDQTGLQCLIYSKIGRAHV